MRMQLHSHYSHHRNSLREQRIILKFTDEMHEPEFHRDQPPLKPGPGTSYEQSVERVQMMYQDIRSKVKPPTGSNEEGWWNQ